MNLSTLLLFCHSLFALFCYQLTWSMPSGETTVYYWEYISRKEVGHISMRLSDGTYISHWPDHTQKRLLSITNKPAAQMTHEEDLALEGRLPLQYTFPSYCLNESAIKEWWTEFTNDKDKKYHLTKLNCAHVVNQALQTGLLYPVHDTFKWNTKMLQFFGPLIGLGGLGDFLSKVGEPTKDTMEIPISVFNHIRRLFSEHLRDYYQHYWTIQNRIATLKVVQIPRTLNRPEKLTEEFENKTFEVFVHVLVQCKDAEQLWEGCALSEFEKAKIDYFSRSMKTLSQIEDMENGKIEYNQEIGQSLFDQINDHLGSIFLLSDSQMHTYEFILKNPGKGSRKENSSSNDNSQNDNSLDEYAIPIDNSLNDKSPHEEL